ncbi:MAG: hypothetical protein ABR534_04520 [Desulfotignum sp.]|nr:hypothetical protein [Desulfobacteraceae bacterium]
MAQWMTITDAVDAFDLYDLFSEIVDSYSLEMDDPDSIASELIELLEEHEEEYEFAADSDGDYTESFERNLRDAVGAIFEEYNLGDLPEEDFDDTAVDEDDLTEIYEDKFDNGIKQSRVDLESFEDDPEEDDAD